MPKNKSARIAQITAQFENIYGNDDTKLEMWQRLCRDVGVSEGASIRGCKKQLKGVYINIVDFLEAQRTGRQVHRFGTCKALGHYIQDNPNKIYPKGAAKNSPILSWMLIPVF